jgi:hypothetical protein
MANQSKLSRVDKDRLKRVADYLRISVETLMENYGSDEINIFGNILEQPTAEERIEVNHSLEAESSSSSNFSLIAPLTNNPPMIK